MKNLSKCLALALLLAPTAAQAELWCSGDDLNIWRYRTALIPDDYNPGSLDFDDLLETKLYVNNECQHYWNSFASHVPAVVDSAEFHIEMYSVGDPVQWKYRCLACRTGFPAPEPRPGVLRPYFAGGKIANDLVPGEVVSIVLHAAGSDHPYYLVDILSKSELVQVEVDVKSGHAEVVKEEEGGGICRQ